MGLRKLVNDKNISINLSSNDKKNEKCPKVGWATVEKSVEKVKGKKKPYSPWDFRAIRGKEKISIVKHNKDRVKKSMFST